MSADRLAPDAGITRRRLVGGAACVAAAAAMPGSVAAAPTPPWADWRDLLNMLPDAASLTAARAAAGLPAQAFTVQKIEEANATKVNFDLYSVEIQRLPTGTTAPKLFETVRQKLNDFFDNSLATVSGFTAKDKDKWAAAGNAPLGDIMLFKIPVMGLLQEQAAVITSLSENMRWIFTPVKIRLVCPGEHPVSGNREFGWKAAPGGKFQFYTRAADRSTGICFSMGEDTIYNGGDALWKSWQKKLTEYIVAHGGQATAAAPVFHRPKWSDVTASGLFTRHG